MNKLSKMTTFALGALLFGNLLVAGAKVGLAQGEDATMAPSIAPSQSETGKPACWVAIGNKLYFVEKDDTTILKVKASGAL